MIILIEDLAKLDGAIDIEGMRGCAIERYNPNDGGIAGRWLISGQASWGRSSWIESPGARFELIDGIYWLYQGPR